MTEWDVTPPARWVYGVAVKHQDPATGKQWMVRRYIGWAKNVLASDGTFEPMRPSFFRRLALRRAREWALERDVLARPRTFGDRPPSGYDDAP